MAGFRALRYALALWPLYFATACVSEPPLVECTGSVVTTVENSCEAGLWDVPLDIKIDGQVVGSIGVDRAPSGSFKFTNRPHELEVWVGKRQLTYEPMFCQAGEHQEFSLRLKHLGTILLDPTATIPCEGRACLTAVDRVATRNDTICLTYSHLIHPAVTPGDRLPGPEADRD